jgi:hypothetical protein
MRKGLQKTQIKRGALQHQDPNRKDNINIKTNSKK